ncbi:uncharacterized protein LOC143200245 [Rhynchophorus ferrugineus]|uniref:uncharacterized protein LOC143200245 n=1 Tax=Rhynchophorus ferrugineus TaxID=354439 RepID=UPI003FCE5BF8
MNSKGPGSDGVRDLIDLLGNLKTNTEESKKKPINILLLGETGVGKSTFINSLVNYLTHGDFKVAERKDLLVLIPSVFSMTDKNGDLRMIKVGDTEDTNEIFEVGESATQDVRTYCFNVKNNEYHIRLIDTPGMGDTRGIEQDNLNCDNILNYISGIHELHAICYLCKPQLTRATVYFQYCVSQIMTRLHADACKNFIFIFTSCKAEQYTPGETINLLKRMADEISAKPAHAKLKLDDNKFCFDNEAFRYLAAVKQGVQLKAEVRSDAIRSWSKATEECWKLFDYITKLKPHHVGITSAVNEARRVIYQLSKPMADIAELVQDNIRVLERHEQDLSIQSGSVQDLKRKLYIPTIKLEVTKLNQPTTVCADIKCCDVYQIDSRNEYHYKTRCHEPCYLQNVKGEVMGAPELMSCAAMQGGQTCKKCGCSYRVHMHVYYFTKKVEERKEDKTISTTIKSREDAIRRIRQLIQDSRETKRLYDAEMETITKANAKFAHFLERNAIAAFTDAYAEYIEYLVTREQSLGRNCDKPRLRALQTLLREHNEQKKIFDDAAKEQERLGRQDPITPQIISQTMSELFNLPLNGEYIKTMYNSQKTARKKEHASTEYTHSLTLNPTTRPNSTGGNRGGKAGGNRGGNAGGNRGGNAGGNRGGNAGSNRGGNAGGNRGGNAGGNRGANAGSNRGGNAEGNRGGNSRGNRGGNTEGNREDNARDNRGWNTGDNRGRYRESQHNRQSTHRERTPSPIRLSSSRSRDNLGPAYPEYRQAYRNPSPPPHLPPVYDQRYCYYPDHGPTSRDYCPQPDRYRTSDYHARSANYRHSYDDRPTGYYHPSRNNDYPPPYEEERDWPPRYREHSSYEARGADPTHNPSYNPRYEDDYRRDRRPYN